MKKFTTIIMAMIAFVFSASAQTVLVDEDSLGLTDGTESEPSSTALVNDMGDFIDTSVLKPYSETLSYKKWGGMGLYAAGGCIAIKDGWFLNTPAGDMSGNVTITFRARLLDASVDGTNAMDVIFLNRKQLVDFARKHCTLTGDWKTFTLSSDKGNFESTGVQFFCNTEATVLIDDIRIEQEQTSISSPVAQDAENVTETSFTAVWKPTAEAEHYLLNVYSKHETDSLQEVTEGFDGIHADADGRIDATNPNYPTGWTFTWADTSAKGHIIKGVGYDLSSVDIKHKVVKGDSANKGNAFTNIWTGSEVISWTQGSNNSVFVNAADLADKLADAKAGDKLRMSYSGLGFGTAQGKILANWTSLTDLQTAKFTGGSYFEYTLTDEWLTAIKEKGLRVSGIGYTLNSIDLVTPEKEYSIIAQNDDADIKAWEGDETPKLGMTITNIESMEVAVPYKVTLMRDMVDDDTQTHSIYQTYSQDVTLAAGETKHVDLVFDGLKEPGFYNLTANVDHNDVCSYNIGYDPKNVPIKGTTPNDFWSYWQEGLDELAATDADIQMEELTDKSSDKRKIYLVTMKSVADSKGGSPVTIRGYYAEPTAEGKYPTIIHYQGTDGGSGTPWCVGADDNPEYCEFILSTRGQMLNNREPNLEDNVYGRDDNGKTDYYSYGWGDKEKHYYRGAYLDCVRAIDFVKTREKVDANNLYAAGGSQGGCFTYVAEGLSGAFRAIAPSITGHADFEEGMKIVNWPRANFLAAAEKLGMTTEQMNEFNSYFDVMNFSEHVTCPVISCFSLQDTTDPTRTNLAPFNLLDKVNAEDKVYTINPFLGHATPADWGSKYMAFFKKYYVDTTTAIN